MWLVCRLLFLLGTDNNGSELLGTDDDDKELLVTDDDDIELVDALDGGSELRGILDDCSGLLGTLDNGVLVEIIPSFKCTCISRGMVISSRIRFLNEPSSITTSEYWINVEFGAVRFSLYVFP